MMRALWIFTCWTFLAMIGSPARGHGIPLEIDADGQGQLHAPSLFNYDSDESQLEPFPVGTPSIVRGAAQFEPVFGGGIPAGTVLTVDATGSPKHEQALLFWNGGSVLPSPVTIALTRTGVDFQVSSLDTFVAGGALGAYNGELGGHSTLNVVLPLDAPIGLYAIGFQVSAPGFARSQTFWGIANNGVSEAAATRGLAAIGVAVPEPSALVLASLGLFTARRMRRRQ